MRKTAGGWRQFYVSADFGFKSTCRVVPHALSAGEGLGDATLLRSWRAGVFSVMRIYFSATLRYASAMSRPNFTEVYYFSHAVLLPPDGATITIIPFLKTSPFSLRSLLLEQSRVPSTYACNENISFHIRNVLLLFPCYCYTCDLCYLVRVEPNG
jgi:hypothetical protein